MAKIPSWKITDLARALEPFLIQQVTNIANLGGVCVTITCAATGYRIAGGTSTTRTLVHETAFQLDTGGNARGAAATDLQITRALATQVASGSNSHIGGGGRNTASGADAVVAGGWLNVASGDESAVGGGMSNQANADFATVAGGGQNVIAALCSWGFIGGGDGNDITLVAVATGFYNTLVGGLNNLIQDALSCVIVGGEAITIRGTGGTKVQHNFAGAGQSNVIENANYATLPGGATNQISKDYATIPGGAVRESR